MLFTLLLFSTAKAYTIHCTPLKMPIPSYEDCNAVLLWMRGEIPELPPTWGQSVPTDPYENTIALPRGYHLTPLYPTEKPPNCEVYFDNVPGREKFIDKFGYNRIVQAAQALMNECGPKGQGGVVDPSGNRVVFLTVRSMWSGDGGERANGGNYTSVEMKPDTKPETVVKTEVSKRVKRWRSFE